MEFFRLGGPPDHSMNTQIMQDGSWFVAQIKRFPFLLQGLDSRDFGPRFGQEIRRFCTKNYTTKSTSRLNIKAHIPDKTG